MVVINRAGMIVDGASCASLLSLRAVEIYAENDEGKWELEFKYSTGEDNSWFYNNAAEQEEAYAAILSYFGLDAQQVDRELSLARNKSGDGPGSGYTSVLKQASN